MTKDNYYSKIILQNFLMWDFKEYVMKHPNLKSLRRNAYTFIKSCKDLSRIEPYNKYDSTFKFRGETVTLQSILNGCSYWLDEIIRISKTSWIKK